jgi:hypothetical protein
MEKVEVGKGETGTGRVHVSSALTYGIILMCAIFVTLSGSRKIKFADETPAAVGKGDQPLVKVLMVHHCLYFVEKSKPQSKVSSLLFPTFLYLPTKLVQIYYSDKLHYGPESSSGGGSGGGPKGCCIIS